MRKLSCVLPPLCVVHAGPLPTIGPKPEWAFMNKAVPDGSSTSLVMPLSDSDAEVEDDLSSHLDQLTREIERETRALFQDTHNTGF